MYEILYDMYGDREMTIELTKHYENGKLVNVTIKTKEKTKQELNVWYDFEEMRLEHERKQENEMRMKHD